MKFVDKIIVAQPNWCVPAVLEMVLRHYGILDYTQFSIAEQLNIVPASDDIVSTKWGAQISDNTLNDFFVNNCIKLQEKFRSIHLYMDEDFFADEIKLLLAKDITIVCGYSYTWLFGNREDSFGHVSIIVGVSDDLQNIYLLDPGPKNAGYKSVSAHDLFYAIKARNDGLWCIQKQQATSSC